MVRERKRRWKQVKGWEEKSERKRVHKKGAKKDKNWRKFY